MGQCPVCDVPLDERALGEQRVAGCQECGGIWAHAAVLAAAVKERPADVAQLDKCFNPSHARSLRLPREPVCAECGGPLAARAFPIAPELSLLSCAACHMLFLADDQATELVRQVAPDALEPVAPPVATDEEEGEEDDDDPGEDWRTWEWAGRVQGQPWLSWAVCGMPLRAALVGMLVPALLATLGMGLAGAPVGLVLAAPLLAYLGWACEAGVLMIALRVTWGVSGGSVSLSDKQLFRLLLRVVVVQLTALVAGGLVLQLAGLADAAPYYNAVVGLVIYRAVLELDWPEILVLTVVSSALGGMSGAALAG